MPTLGASGIVALGLTVGFVILELFLMTQGFGGAIAATVLPFIALPVLALAWGIAAWNSPANKAKHRLRVAKSSEVDPLVEACGVCGTMGSFANLCPICLSRGRPIAIARSLQAELFLRWREDGVLTDDPT